MWQLREWKGLSTFLGLLLGTVKISRCPPPRVMTLVLLTKLEETLLKIQTFPGIQMETSALHAYLAITKLCSSETCLFLLNPDCLGFSMCKASGGTQSNGVTKQDSTETEFIKSALTD